MSHEEAQKKPTKGPKIFEPFVYFVPFVVNFREVAGR